MTTQSCKSKGRKAQQAVRDHLRILGASYDLEDDDIKSTSMGVSGLDIVLSPAARKVFDLAVEVKCVEKLVVPTTFWKHYNLYKDSPSLKLLVHSKNRHTPLVTLRIEDFMKILEKSIA